MSITSIISNAKHVSGEMFDLTTSSFNNAFGAEHNAGTIKYGINFPIEKFIKELEMILANTDDDKTSKRQNRLAFLHFCNSSNEVKSFFRLFCNYLNGGGTDSISDNWAMQQYYDNFIVITAAGGNIVILFAQLIGNMIEAFIHTVSGRTDWKWDIDDPEFETSVLEGNSSAVIDALFYTKFESWDKRYYDVVNYVFTLLTRTNQVLLDGLQKIDGRFPKEVLCFIIIKYFFELDNSMPDNKVLDALWNVALSDISDFDFKLSPNIHPAKAGGPITNPLPDTSEGVGAIFDDSRLDSFIYTLVSNIKEDESPGFLLFRVKTLIDCSTHYTERYTSEELKTWQRDCSNKLGSFVWGLYPQIMKASYLNDVPLTSDCYKFLKHLQEKKIAIREATQYSIDETIKFYMAGYFKQSNVLGERFALVNPAQNSTEAIIAYISNITYHLNIYIRKWEKFSDYTDDTGKIIHEHILSRNAAPALHNGGLPEGFSHESVCHNFLSLDSILLSDEGLISRLSADIINYFLNDPKFNTENILDNLIISFNSKRASLTGTTSNCFIPPSDLIAVPTNPKFNASLRKIRKILDDSRRSELGFPDGIRITLNAIETKDEIGDTQLDHVEVKAQKSTKGDTSIETGYSILNKNVRGKGIKNQLRAKKVKTKRRKQEKIKKTKKHKKHEKHEKHKKSRMRKKRNKRKNSKTNRKKNSTTRRRFTKKYNTAIKNYNV